MQLVLRDDFGDDPPSGFRLQASDRGTCMALFEGCMVVCVLTKECGEDPSPVKIRSERGNEHRQEKRSGGQFFIASPASKPSLEARTDTDRLTTAFTAGRCVIVQKK